MRDEAQKEPAGRGIPSVQLVCPRCERFSLLSAGSGGTFPLRCPECGLVFEGGSAPPPDDRPLESCPVCGSDELYVQKDFNRQLGLGIVVASFLVIFFVMVELGHLIGIYLLFGLAAVDWLVYRSIAAVTVCYRCQSVHRGRPLNSTHVGFDLGLEEKHKRLRQDWARDLIGETRAS